MEIIRKESNRMFKIVIFRICILICVFNVACTRHFTLDIQMAEEAIVKELTKAELEADICVEESTIRGFNDVWTHYEMRQLIYDKIGISTRRDLETLIAIETGLDRAYNYIIAKYNKTFKAYKVDVRGFSGDDIIVEEKILTESCWDEICLLIDDILKTHSIIKKELPGADEQSYIIYTIDKKNIRVRVLYGLWMIFDKNKKCPVLSTYKNSIDNIINIIECVAATHGEGKIKRSTVQIPLNHVVPQRVHDSALLIVFMLRYGSAATRSTIQFPLDGVDSYARVVRPFYPASGSVGRRTGISMIRRHGRRSRAL